MTTSLTAETLTYEVVDQRGPGAHTVVTRVWPCKCGDTHRGTYAEDTWFMHNCGHKELVLLHDAGLVLCVQCEWMTQVSDD